MSEDKANNLGQEQNENQNLDFQEAKDMTIGEAVRKDTELKAGVTDDDGILDKYIKQHREEVASQTYANREEVSGDTSPLDEFIRKQRQELVDSGLLDQETVTNLEAQEASGQSAELDKEPDSDSSGSFSSEESENKGDVSDDNAAAVASETADFDLNETIVAPAITEAELDPTAPLLDDIDLSETQDLSETLGNTTAVFDDVPLTYADSEASLQENTEETDTIAAERADKAENTPFYKKKGVIIGALAVLLLVIAGAAGAFYLSNRNSSTTAETSSSSNTAASKTKDSFDKLYAGFFVDDKQTKLKNSEFTNLSELKTQLDKLNGTDYYDKSKDQYSSLKKQIKAIQTVNALFEEEAIVDGAYNKDIQVKSDANFDTLSEDVTSTGNATLDRLIQEAIKGGKEQLAAMASSSSSAAAAASSAVPSASSAAEAASGSANAGTSNNTSSSSASSTVTTGGITNYDESTLQRSSSRVSYNATAVADTSNPAWTWGDGILDKVVSTAQSRGYISGNNYILEPVNIVNGNGYYNMYRPDGTYLFSINCKTGYFVGNGSGHSDDLDY